MDSSVTKARDPRPYLPCGSNSKESAGNAGDLGSILVSVRSPGEENGNPLQDSHVGNAMDRLVGYSLWVPKS